MKDNRQALNVLNYIITKIKYLISEMKPKQESYIVSMTNTSRRVKSAFKFQYELMA